MPNPLGPQSNRSLEEVHRSVPVSSFRGWRRMFAFAGPAYLVSVGYMDPGNWATDLEGGAHFGYDLLWVLLMSNIMAVLLQTLSARLGLVTGRDLAQACRDEYPRPVGAVLFVLCEIAIAACDLAEVLGSAIGLYLLFGIDLITGVLITGADVLLLLLIQHFGIRKLEAFILLLVTTIGLCFLVEIFLCRPSPTGIAMGFIPGSLGDGRLFIAIGILGATVMPHNLYLHSALVQSRDVQRSRASVAEACRMNLIDSTVAMNGAFLVNAAILIVAAATFFRTDAQFTGVLQAPEMLHQVLGTVVAPYAFAIALLCAGQSSTITGTLAGQITMEGFLRFRIKPWLRRMVTRSLAIVPAVTVIALMGEEVVTDLLVLSQVILSLQLSFAVVPLVRFTSSKQKMGPFASPYWVQVLAWLVTAVIVGLNLALVSQKLIEWVAAAGDWGWLVVIGVAPVALGLLGLLGWMTFRRERLSAPPPAISAESMATIAAAEPKRFCRIGVALEVAPTDAAMLAEAVAMAKLHRAGLVLLHVVDGVGGTWYGPQTGDSESRDDELYLEGLADQLRGELKDQGVPGVEAILGFGNPATELVSIARREKIDFLVLGSHGHRGLADLIYGQTIPGVRHGLDIPILTVRS